MTMLVGCLCKGVENYAGGWIVKGLMETFRSPNFPFGIGGYIYFARAFLTEEEVDGGGAVTVRVMDPEARILSESVSKSLEIDRMLKHATLTIREEVKVKLHTPGIHLIDLLVNGELMARTPFYVYEDVTIKPPGLSQ
jgi:hypothetical protein